jgi:tetratricopeptide (TPR) repeat protein
VVSTPLADAKRLVADGRPEQAIGLLRQHLARSGDDHAARNLLAYALFCDGDLQAAEAEYRTMVARPDPDARDQLSLGRTLECQGRLEEARAWIAAAAASGLKAAVDDQVRLTQPAPSLQAPEPKPGPLSELGIPQNEEELDRFTRLLRARAKQDWWTQNWYSIPWGLRLAYVIALVAILAFTGWVFANLLAGIETHPTPPTLPANADALLGVALIGPTNRALRERRRLPHQPAHARSGRGASVPAGPFCPGALHRHSVA